ncbi:hypothetical protein [Paraburkholderia sp. BL18I3N2]|uniref:hypothetical protein n=1 Tax=Paraburkholderia sp. BL18I3N2 TaxID=1938799 RepID=UPI0015E747AD|nr:hypothetical protein [Paraburkholderia sp. BL18I3N2]
MREPLLELAGRREVFHLIGFVLFIMINRLDLIVGTINSGVNKAKFLAALNGLPGCDGADESIEDRAGQIGSIEYGHGPRQGWRCD